MMVISRACVVDGWCWVSRACGWPKVYKKVLTVWLLGFRVYAR